MTVGQVPVMLDHPQDTDGRLVPAAGYYSPGRRFSAAVNADRIASAQRGAAALGGGQAIATDFERAWREALAAARAASPGRVVRTRHGDRMLLTEFLRTRVLELAVHGLDLATGLGNQPWMTAAAADLVAGVLLPATVATRLRGETGWELTTMIAKTTGRQPLTEAETALIERHGIRWLRLG
jgi:Mycothiol maleylpyruvate isomerase N-terminal domain